MTEVSWPPDYPAEFWRRYYMTRDAANDPELQSKAIKFYGDNCLAWIEDYCVTFDPRNEPPIPRVMPFILLPKQVDLVNFLLGCLGDKESGLVEKSRDMGATWVCCCVALWLWLFKPGSVIGFGSRKEEYVDKKGDPKAIFPKIRQLIDNLPRWMLPAGFVRREHDTFMKLSNPENGSAITGEAGDNIGRGGRTTVYFKDESAHYEHPESIEAALGDNTNVQIDISSVFGTGNVFHRRRMAGVEWGPGREMPKGKTRVFVLDWRDHPAKTQEWHDLRRVKAEAEGLLHIFNQEVERDYSGAVEGVIIRAEWARALLDAHKFLAHLGDWTAGEKIGGQDVADGGGDRNAYVARHGALMCRAQAWAGEAGDAAARALEYAVEDQIQELDYDCIGVGTGFKVGVNVLKETGAWPSRLRVMPWDASAEVLNPDDPVIPNDLESPTNKDVYENLKAQAWFAFRARCWKTFLAVTRGAVYPIEELASVPSDMENAQQVIMELSQPVKKTSLSSGKTVVDKKPDGATSPNLADGTVMCYFPTREISILDVL